MREGGREGVFSQVCVRHRGRRAPERQRAVRCASSILEPQASKHANPAAACALLHACAFCPQVRVTMYPKASGNGIKANALM